MRGTTRTVTLCLTVRFWAPYRRAACGEGWRRGHAASSPKPAPFQSRCFCVDWPGYRSRTQHLFSPDASLWTGRARPTDTFEKGPIHHTLHECQGSTSPIASINLVLSALFNFSSILLIVACSLSLLESFDVKLALHLKLYLHNSYFSYNSYFPHNSYLFFVTSHKRYLTWFF